MNWFQELLSNPFLLIGLSSWFWAQLIKTIIHAIVTKSIDFTRLIGDGGMPSGHSATVSSLATAAALVYGLGSFEFAMAFIFAIVVCKDAMGVRLETGRQAVIINDIVEAFNSLASEKLPEAKPPIRWSTTPNTIISTMFNLYYSWDGHLAPLIAPQGETVRIDASNAGLRLCRALQQLRLWQTALFQRL